MKISRLSFPGDEKANPWLPLLLTAAAVIDEGVAVAVRRMEKLRGAPLACRSGCGSCCRTQTDIPVYPHEIVGLYWFVTEKLVEPARGALREQLAAHGDGSPCPFLYRDACAVHPIRPAACRQFNVFGEPCRAGEDPFFTRREDVLTPIEEYTHRAFSLVLPLYGVAEERARTPETVRRLIRSRAVNLREYDWSRLAARMDGAE